MYWGFMAANNGNLVYRTFYDNSGPNLYCVFKVLRYLYLCTGYTRYIYRFALSRKFKRNSRVSILGSIHLRRFWVRKLESKREYKKTKSIYKFGLSVCLSVCLFVCLYPINVKTAEPIRPKFFVGHHVTSGKVYELS